MLFKGPEQIALYTSHRVNLPQVYKIEFYIVPSVSCFIVFKALEALFGPDFDLVTSARFLPKSVLGMFNNIYRKSNDLDSSY